MSIEIFMPALSPTMEKGTLAKWLVKEGDKIESGDVLAEIETDKATMEVESIDDGTVAKILIEEGAEDVPVGEIIAILAEDGEDVNDVEAPTAKKADAPAPAPAPAPTPEPEKASEPAPKAAASSVTPSASENVSQKSAGDSRVKASPLARRIAEQKGLNLKDTAGSGPYGRIIKRDVENAKAGAPAADQSHTSASQPVAQDGDAPFRTEKLSGMRKVIAKRLTESKQTVPHFYLTVEIELDTLMAARKQLNAHLEAEGVKLSVNDFIIKASAMALKKVPAANVQYAGDTMRWYERADISVAVAIEGGLVTPVVRGACAKSLSAIASEVQDLATRARDGKLLPEEYAGGTFSISNLGMFGIKEFSAVINPPQGAILAVGAGEQRAVVIDGQVVPATMMNCTLSCDHRAIDGAVGAEFLKAFKGFLENPITMMA